jgi:uncharacterized protein YegL
MSETAAVSTGEQILPFYIVCDESGSMGANGGIDAINRALPDVHSALASDPLVSDKARIGLIVFSDEAEELMSLTRAADVSAFPGVQAKGLTNFGDAFRTLNDVIVRDIAELKQQGYRVFRPAVFFISDGEPNEAWEDDYDDLMNNDSARPNIVAFGVDSADLGVMKRIATVACYMSEDNANPGPVLREIMKALTNSIITSTNAPTPQFVAPPAPDGCVSVALDEM